MKQLFIVAIGILLIPIATFSQRVSHKNAALNVGDAIPNMEISNIVNFPRSSFALSGVKGKQALILDFFATWCGSCIKELPKLDSLQRLMQDSLQVLVISYESKKVIQSFLNKHPKIKALKLPFVCDDTLLHRLFPHKLIPHEVLINPGLSIKAITHADAITVPVLRSLYSGETLWLPLKSDVLNYDVKKSFLENESSKAERLKYQSALTGFINGVGSMDGIEKTGNYIKYYYINKPILQLYEAAIGKKIDRQKLVLYVSDTNVYFRNQQPWHEWGPINAMCYELYVPIGTHRNYVRELMLQDLNRYLRLRGRFVISGESEIFILSEASQ